VIGEVNIPSVLFVCTAGIFRSPIAGALLWNKVATRSDATNWCIISTGVWNEDIMLCPLLNTIPLVILWAE
jgi:protein-tyrosine-phosphatase